jgi:hypothetical protein
MAEKKKGTLLQKCWNLMCTMQNCSINLGIKKEKNKRKFKIAKKIIKNGLYLHILAMTKEPSPTYFPNII